MRTPVRATQSGLTSSRNTRNVHTVKPKYFSVLSACSVAIEENTL